MAALMQMLGGAGGTSTITVQYIDDSFLVDEGDRVDISTPSLDAVVVSTILSKFFIRVSSGYLS